MAPFRYPSLFLERACQVQLYAMWTSKALKRVSGAVVAKTLAQFNSMVGNPPPSTTSPR